MRHRYLTTCGVLAALMIAPVIGSAALAADPAPTPGTPAADGKNKGLSLSDFENSLWTPDKKKAEITKEAARQEKIKKLLSLVNDPTYQNKADALFRLAETYWQSGKFLYFMERDKYDASMKCFEEKRCAEEPVEPTEDQTTAIDYYQKVLLASPDYERLDQVTYFLGRAKIESGKSKKDIQMQLDGEKFLKDVTVKWPKSSYVPEAHLTLAEYYFEKDQLFYAKTNYESIIQKFKDHPMFNYALYKLGWVYFNLAEFEQTIDTFHKVIAATKKETSTGMVEFREQALNDLIQAYAEVDNGWELARDYFKKEMSEEDTYDKLDKMAALLVTKDKDTEAVELYKHLIEHNKVSAKIPEYFDAVMEVRRKINDPRETEAEINELTEYLDHKGAWWTANKNNSAATEKADELVSGNLAYLANSYHKAAQKAEDDKKTAEAASGYDNAVKYYAMFLERYPDHPDSYKFNFFYAEILYDRAKYMEAAEQYEKTLQKDQKGDFVEDAALGVVYSIDKELCRLGKRQCTDGDNIKVTVVKDDGTISAEKTQEIPNTPLDPLEQRMISAADTYVKVLSSNLKDPEWVKKYPGRGQKIPNMMYVSADIFYRHGQFKEAVTRLQVIFDLFPKDQMAGYAVDLIVDAYKRLKNWVQIEKWARDVIEKRNFTTRSQEDWEKIIAISKTEYAKELTLQRKYDEAVRVQEEIVQEFGKKNPDVASKALFNVGAIHEVARRFPQAVEAYEQVIKRYKDREVAVDAQSAIGIIYESQTEFAKAAEAFVGMQQFKSSFNRNPAAAERAANAYRDAGVLYEALEEYDKATEVFETYIKTYGGRDDVPRVAFEAALSQEFKSTPDGFANAGKIYERISKTYGRKDTNYELRATAAAALAYKRADKVKNRKKVEGLFRSVTKSWEKIKKAVDAGKMQEPDAETKYYAALSHFELAEYAYDDYNAIQIEAVSKSGSFDTNLLRKTLTAKAEGLKTAEKAFDKVLDFKDKGMAAAAAFRLGQILYEFAEGLFNAPVPPGLTADQVDEYRFQLEEFAAPIQERALAAFTAALKQAVNDGVYNKWSRQSAIYAAKVNKDEFPIAEFTVQPDKTRDTVLSTSFIKAVRRGSIVVDYLNSKSTDTSKEPGDGDGDGKPDEKKPDDKKPEGATTPSANK